MSHVQCVYTIEGYCKVETAVNVYLWCDCIGGSDGGKWPMEKIMEHSLEDKLNHHYNASLFIRKSGMTAISTRYSIT